MTLESRSKEVRNYEPVTAERHSGTRGSSATVVLERLPDEMRTKARMASNMMATFGRRPATWSGFRCTPVTLKTETAVHTGRLFTANRRGLGEEPRCHRHE